MHTPSRWYAEPDLGRVCGHLLQPKTPITASAETKWSSAAGWESTVIRRTRGSAARKNSTLQWGGGTRPL